MTLTNKLFVLLQHCIPQHLISRIVGYLADTRIVWLKNFLIKHFINHFNVNMEEAENSDYRSYATFNEFFTRPLQPGARPLDQTPGEILSPCDGMISEIGDINSHSLIQAKGKSFSLRGLLGGSNELSNTFANGKFATIYLSPKDYHRVHMPFKGSLIKTMYVPGKLFSVNPVTTQSVDHLFARNERLISIFETDKGPIAVIMVGAMIVAGIETVWSGQITPKSKQLTTTDFSKPITLQSGDELGRFKLGSTVILLFPEHTINWHTALAENSQLKMGQAIATS